MRFAHIGIKVLDMAESIKFYTEVLECSLIKEEIFPHARLAFLDTDGCTIELIYKEENEERPYGAMEHIAFLVESLEAQVALLERKGIRPTNPRDVGGNRIVFFDGPNNERIEFMEKL